MKIPPKSRSRRRLFSLALAFALLGVLITLLLEVVLPGVARDRIRHELSASGLTGARFELRRVGLDGVTLADVALAPDLVIEEVAIELDLLEGRAESITLTGARLTTSPSTFDESSVARLLTREAPPSDVEPPTVRLVRSTVVLAGAEEPVRVAIDGEVRPAEGRARLTLRSPLGRHVVSIREREEAGARVVDVDGRGGGDALDAVVRIADGDVSARGRVTLAPGARRWASHRLTTEGARAEGSARIEAGRVSALDLRATAQGVVLDARPALDLALEAGREGGAIAWQADARGDGELHARAAGALGLDPAAWEPAFAWAIRGPIPSAVANDAAPFLRVEADPQLALTGRARRDESTWRVDGIRGHVSVEALQIPDAELVLERVRMEVGASASVRSGRVDVEIAEGSRLLTDALHLDALHIEALDAAPVLHVVLDRGGLRVEAPEPIDARMEQLAVGEGSSAIRFEDVAMALASRGGAPIATSAGDRTALAARMDASAPRIAGVLRGRRVRASSDIDVTIGAQGASAGAGTSRSADDEDARIAIPLAVRAARIEEAESELSLRNVWLELPLRWEHGDVRAEGRMRAERMAWREVSIGETSGGVRLADDILSLDWRAPASASAAFTLAVRMALEDGGGSVRVRVPRVHVGEQDPLSNVLAALTELRIEGAVQGELRLDLDAPDRGEARLVLHGASVREVDGAGEAHGVHAALRFTHLTPLETASPAAVRWERLELGGVKLDAGSARLAFARPDDVVVSDMRVGLAGGEVEVEAFRFAWEEPDVPLELRVRGIELSRVLRAATDGRVTGEGKLDGRVALRIKLGEDRRILLGDGHLASRGPGALRVRTDAQDPALRPEVGDLVDGSFIRRRVLAAIEDFEYRTLTMNISDEGTRRLRARVVGRGKQMPQELDVTLNFRGVQPLLDHAVRLWPDGAEASIEVGPR